MAASSASAENLLKWISRELLGTAGKSLQSAEHEKGEEKLDKYLEEKNMKKETVKDCVYYLPLAAPISP